MKKVHLFVIKSYLGPLVMTFFISLFILLMQFVWKYIDDFVGKGLEWTIIAKLLLYMSTTFVPLALPLAILLASLMTFGNLGEHYELAALKSSGISLRQIMKPLIIISIIISVAAFYFSNNLMPIANLKAHSLLFDVREQKPAVNIREGVFYGEIDNYIIKVGKKDSDGKTIHNIMIYDHSGRMGNSNLTIAESGIMEMTQDNRFLIFTLLNGHNYFEKPENRDEGKSIPFQRTKFSEQIRRIDLSAFAFQKTNEEMFKDHHRMMNIEQLQNSVDSLKKDIKRKSYEFETYMVEGYRFYTLLKADTSKAIIDNSKSTSDQPQTHNDDAESHFSGDSKIAFSQISKRILKANLKIKPDSFSTPKPLFDTTTILNPDFISNFNPEIQKEIADFSINGARTVKNQLEYTNLEINNYNGSIVRHNIEWHRKFTLSIACLLLFFIGAPLGAIIRKGGLGMPLVVSTFFFIAYHVISITGEKLAKEASINHIFGMWLSSFVILPIGIFLMYKATTDSPLLEAEGWNKFFKEIFKRKNENTSGLQ